MDAGHARHGNQVDHVVCCKFGHGLRTRMINRAGKAGDTCIQIYTNDYKCNKCGKVRDSYF